MVFIINGIFLQSFIVGSTKVLPFVLSDENSVNNEDQSFFKDPNVNKVINYIIRVDNINKNLMTKFKHSHDTQTHNQ